MAGLEEELFARAANTNLAIALKAHGDDKAVIFAHVTMLGFVNLHDTDIEERRVDNLYGTIGSFRIDRAIVGLDMEVQGLGSQGCVEFTRLAIETWTVVIEDAIGDIRGLLDLSEEDAPTDGVHTTGREVEYIARLDLVVGKDLGDGAILNAPLVFVGRDLLFEARIEVGTRVGLDDIPHLGLAHLAMLALGHLVVGMHLNAQVALGIDELDQEGQLAVILGVDRLAQNGIGVFGHDRDQVATHKGAIADDAGTRGYRTDLPTLANGLVGRCQALVGAKLRTTPDHGVEIGVE